MARTDFTKWSSWDYGRFSDSLGDLAEELKRQGVPGETIGTVLCTYVQSVFGDGAEKAKIEMPKTEPKVTIEDLLRELKRFSKY